MEYLITFLEGFITFISPCVLPLLPIYISYFSGEGQGKWQTFRSALGFVAGFTAVFCLYGLFAGSIGAVLSRFHTAVEIVGGIIIILLGLNFLGVFRSSSAHKEHHRHCAKGIVSSVVFGMAFAFSHAPCIGAFLGTALMTAGTSGSFGKGALLLLTYSFGLGIPFVLSALLTEKLTPFFGAIKRNYRSINLICGVFLILLGIIMSSGLFHHLLHFIA